MRGQIVAVREHEPVVFEHWVGGTHMHPRRQALDDPFRGRHRERVAVCKPQGGALAALVGGLHDQMVVGVTP